MSDPGVYGCLERALPNTPPPDVWVTAVFPYTTNIMIASMQAVDVKVSFMFNLRAFYVTKNTL